MNFTNKVQIKIDTNVAINPGIIKLWLNIYFPDFIDLVLSHSIAKEKIAVKGIKNNPSTKGIILNISNSVTFSDK